MNDRCSFALLDSKVGVTVYVVALLLLFLVQFIGRCVLEQGRGRFTIRSVVKVRRGAVNEVFFTRALVVNVFSVLVNVFYNMFYSRFVATVLLATCKRPCRVS